MTDVQQWIEQLTDNDTQKRNQAQKALIDMGSSAVDALIAALDRYTGWQQRAVIAVLTGLKDQRAVQPLLRLLTDSDPQTRVSAAVALGQLQEKSAISTVRQMAVEETDAFQRASLTEVMVKLGESTWALDYAKQILLDNQAANKDRQAMIQMMVRLKDPSSADLLLEVLKAQEFGVWRYALDALKELQDRRAVDVLLPLLSHKEANWRGTAALALADFGDERAIEPIKALLKDKTIAWQGDRPGEPSTTVAMAAQQALKKLGSNLNPEPESEVKKPRWKLW